MVVPSEGTVPANLTGFDRFGRCYVGDESIALSRLDDSGPQAVALEVQPPNRVALREPLVEGVRYRIEGCAKASEFVVGAAAALPVALGTINFVEEAAHRGGVPADGPCSDTASIASAQVVFAPADALDPWLPYLDFTFEVTAPGQGTRGWTFPVRTYTYQAHPPASVQARTSFMPYALCEPKAGVSFGLAPGHYTGVLKARVPGTDHVVATAPAPFELLCTPTIPDDVTAEPVEPDGAASEVIEPAPEPSPDTELAEVIVAEPASNAEGCGTGSTSLVGLVLLALRRRRVVHACAVAVMSVSLVEVARPCSPIHSFAVVPSVGTVPANLEGFDRFGGCSYTPEDN